MAMWELAPGSPWNAIFSFLVMSFFLAGPFSSDSGFCQYGAGGFEVLGGIDAQRHRIDGGRVDAHAGFHRPELLELLALFQRGGRQLDETLQRPAPIGIEPD